AHWSPPYSLGKQAPGVGRLSRAVPRKVLKLQQAGATDETRMEHGSRRKRKQSHERKGTESGTRQAFSPSFPSPSSLSVFHLCFIRGSFVYTLSKVLRCRGDTNPVPVRHDACFPNRTPLVRLGASEHGC